MFAHLARPDTIGPLDSWLNWAANTADSVVLPTKTICNPYPYADTLVMAGKVPLLPSHCAPCVFISYFLNVLSALASNEINIGREYRLMCHGLTYSYRTAVDGVGSFDLRRETASRTMAGPQGVLNIDPLSVIDAA